MANVTKAELKTLVQHDFVEQVVIKQISLQERRSVASVLALFDEESDQGSLFESAEVAPSGVVYSVIILKKANGSSERKHSYLLNDDQRTIKNFNSVDDVVALLNELKYQGAVSLGLEAV
ncbi:hypothetical protein [Acinetobacter sp. P1(2025)]|uniref:hypothetical protein n=1 Tax=Acinetobacter sp. P1(2025) TaxID=3446120 RepID=UPI003F53D9D1